MNTIQLFVFGQLDMFKAVLAALAVMFDPTKTQFFVSGDGVGAGSAALLASILATLGFIGSYFTQLKYNGTGPVMALVVYAALVVPKVPNVWVTDIYSGRTELVQNVPVGIAVMGFALSSISKGMIDIFEQEYSVPGSVGGQDFLMNMQTNGFLSPLKIMIALRQQTLKEAPLPLMYNIISYYNYCLMKKPDNEPNLPPTSYFNPVEFSTSNTPLEYFIDPTYLSSGYGEKMDPISRVQSVVPCSDILATLTQDQIGGLKFYLNDENSFGKYIYGTLLSSSGQAEIENCRNGNCADKTASIATVDAALNALLGSANQNDKYMKARLMQDIKKITVDSNTALSNASLSNFGNAYTQAIETSRISESVEGETFLHFMIPAMNGLMYIFYALFPLAMVVMVSKGAQAFTYLAGYMLFGFWVYSWMPVAIVINFQTLSSIQQMFTITTGQLPISINSLDDYYQMAMDAVAVGSNLMAATPVITLAILSGSIFALTSVASQASSPSGGTSQATNQLAPSLQSSPPLVNRPSMFVASDGLNQTGGGSQLAQTRAKEFTVKESDLMTSTIAASELVTSQNLHNVAGAINNSYGTNHSVNGGVTNSSTAQFSHSTQTAIDQVRTQAISKTAAQMGITGEDNVKALAAYLTTGGFGAGGHLTQTQKASIQESGNKQFLDNFSQGLSEKDLITTINSELSQQSNGNTLNKSSQEIKQATDAYTTSKSHTDSQRQEFQQNKQKGIMVTESLDDMHNQLNRQGEGGSHKEMNGLVSDYVQQAFQNNGMPLKDQSTNMALFQQQQQTLEKDAFGSEQSSLSSLVSNVMAIDALYQGALKSGDYQLASSYAEAKENLLQHASGRDSIPGYNNTNTTAAAVNKARNGIENSRVQTIVPQEINKVSGQVEDGGSNLNAQDSFSSKELESFKQGGKALNQLVPDSGWQGNKDYNATYFSDAALNMASSNKFAGKQFDQLDDNQKREVLMSQQSEALNAYTQDRSDYIQASSMDLQNKAASIASLNANDDNYNKFQTSLKTNDSAVHSEGTIGKGEMLRSTNAFNETLQQLSSQQIADGNMIGINEQHQEANQQRGRNVADKKDSFITGSNSSVSKDSVSGVLDEMKSLDQQISSGEISQAQGYKQANELIDQQIKNDGTNFLGGDMSKGSAFKTMFDSYMNSGHQPSVSYALALGDLGVNNEGVAQRFVENASFLTPISSAAQLGKDYKLSQETGAEFKPMGEKFESKPTLKNGVSGLLKISGPGLVFSAATSVMEYLTDDNANQKFTMNQTSSLIQGKISESINGLPSNQQTQTRNNFVDGMIDQYYQGMPEQAISLKSQLRQESPDGNYTNNQMQSVMSMVTSNSNQQNSSSNGYFDNMWQDMKGTYDDWFGDDSKSALSNKQLVDIYNNVNVNSGRL
jgi:conjugal transfer mating pair stabilization protein TraG